MLGRTDLSSIDRTMLSSLAEADEMSWRPRPNRTKLINQVRRSQKLVRGIETAKSSALRRYTAQQRQKAEEARARYVAISQRQLFTAISNSLRPVRPDLIVPIFSRLSPTLANRANRLFLEAITTGQITTPGSFVAILFKSASEEAGLNAVTTELLAKAIEESFERANSPVLQAFIATLAVTLPGAVVKSRNALRWLRNREGEFEQSSMEPSL